MGLAVVVGATLNARSHLAAAVKVARVYVSARLARGGGADPLRPRDRAGRAGGVTPAGATEAFNAAEPAGTIGHAPAVLPDRACGPTRTTTIDVGLAGVLAAILALAIPRGRAATALVAARASDRVGHSDGRRRAHP